MLKDTSLIAYFQYTFYIFTDMPDQFAYSIGIMSGTSLDGLDLVYVRFDKTIYSNFEIIACETYPYTVEWSEKLKNAIHFSREEIGVLDREYGQLLGDIVNQFMDANAISKVDFIASHGHTILHEPDKGITLQIGDGQILSDITKLPVVCDFRTQDVQLGGQGAPLVPLGDRLLFSQYASCINLGGFANISFERQGHRIAFDICPVNIVLNYLAGKLGLAYDAYGKIAFSGRIIDGLSDSLNAISFYRKPPPKSLGLEWVMAHVFPLIDGHTMIVEDMLRTFTEHIAVQISKVVGTKSPALITGGGAYNTFLMERISYHADAELVLPSEQVINYKEALIFSFLGLLKIKGEINCLKSVTGAEKNHSTGVIFHPNNI